MILGDITPDELARTASRGELFYRVGPFKLGLHSDYPPLIDLLARLYRESEVFAPEQLADFHVRMTRPRHHRRWWHPQINFLIDGQKPFEPYPLGHALPLLEWGLNWCIAKRAHQFLMLHSAVIERNGRALILPALPGSGKSTLSCTLAHRDWRLLSDEFGLIRPETGLAWPLPKAIPLKNDAIDVIRDYLPEALLGPRFPGTRKGTVAHVKPPQKSLMRQTEPARPAWIVFPKYRAGASSQLEPIAKSVAFTRLAHNSFNYHLQGERGFRTLVTLIRQCDCYSFEYSDLDEAVDLFHELESAP